MILCIALNKRIDYKAITTTVNAMKEIYDNLLHTQKYSENNVNIRKMWKISALL